MQTFKNILALVSVASLFSGLFILASYESYRQDVRICMHDTGGTESQCETKLQ